MTTEAAQDDLLEELVFGAAQGRKAKSLQVEVVRGLTQADIPMLEGGAPAQQSAIQRIRHSHHAVAQGLAQGLDLRAVSLSTGYDPAYISKLKHDPTFAELVAFYEAQQDQILTDVMARMRQLGLSVVDELQHQFDADPDKFSLREKMELCELMLVKSGHVGKGAGGSAPGAPSGAQPPFALSINFLAPAPQERLIDAQLVKED